MFTYYKRLFLLGLKSEFVAVEWGEAPVGDGYEKSVSELINEAKVNGIDLDELNQIAERIDYASKSVKTETKKELIAALNNKKNEPKEVAKPVVEAKAKPKVEVEPKSDFDKAADYYKRKKVDSRLMKMYQYELKVEVTGEFNKKTFDAVVAFQKEHNLIGDGIIGKKTNQALADKYRKEELRKIAAREEALNGNKNIKESIPVVKAGIASVKEKVVPVIKEETKKEEIKKEEIKKKTLNLDVPGLY